MDFFLYFFAMILLVFSIIDWKFLSIPSIFLTAFIFVVAVLYPANLWFGVMSFIMAYLLYEADFFGGVADIKIMTQIGFLISTTNYLFLYIGLVVAFGFIWKVMVLWRMKNEKETAFVPVFLFIYITLLLVGGIK
jgi:hypothetical protein